MINALSNERLTVNGEAFTGSNIYVSMDQVDLVTEALARGGVKFWVREHRSPLVVDGGRPIAIVSLSRTSNTADVQRLLDEL